MRPVSFDRTIEIKFSMLFNHFTLENIQKDLKVLPINSLLRNKKNFICKKVYFTNNSINVNPKLIILISFSFKVYIRNFYLKSLWLPNNIKQIPFIMRSLAIKTPITQVLWSSSSSLWDFSWEAFSEKLIKKLKYLTLPCFSFSEFSSAISGKA